MTVSSFTFQNAVGAVKQLHYEAYTLGSPRGLVVVVVNRTSAQDEDMETATTLSGLLAVSGVDEVTNPGYARHNITSGGTGQLLLSAIAYDTINAYMPADIPDQTYGSPSGVTAGDDWTDLIVCYAPDTGGADSTFVPLTANNSPVTPDGSVITKTFTDYWRGSRP